MRTAFGRLVGRVSLSSLKVAVVCTERRRHSWKDAVTQLATVEKTLFDYASVPEADRDWLRQQEHELGAYARRIAMDVVTIGTMLLEVQNRVGRHFEHWVETRTPFSLRTAYRRIKDAIQFAPVAEQIKQAAGKIDDCAMHILALDSTSAAARSVAIKIIEAGEPLTFARAKEIIAANQKPKAPALFPKECDEPPPPTSGGDTVGEMLAELQPFCSQIVFSTNNDDDEGDPLTGRAYFHDEGRPVSVKLGQNHAEVLYQLLGRRPVKLCGQCFDRFVVDGMPVEEAKKKATKPLDFFVKKPGRKDGHAPECKSCSRDRTARAKDKKSQEAA